MNPNNEQYKLSDDVVYRLVGDELALIEVQSGDFYYFSKESRPFFDYFREPRDLAGYLSKVESEGKTVSPEMVSSLIDMLVEKKILTRASGVAAGEEPEGAYVVPQFLRVGEQKLEDVRFLY